jgi:hypothetical protein
MPDFFSITLFVHLSNRTPKNSDLINMGDNAAKLRRRETYSVALRTAVTVDFAVIVNFSRANHLVLRVIQETLSTCLIGARVCARLQYDVGQVFFFCALPFETFTIIIVIV